MKLKNELKVFGIAFGSGLIMNLANTNLWIVLICIGIAPLFVLLNDNSKNAAGKIGFFFGTGIGIGMFSWMIKGVSHYTGDGFFYGICICLLSSLCLGFYFAVLSWVLKSVWISNPDSKSLLLSNRVAVASIWTLSEWIVANTLESFPLHYFRTGFPFVTNLYSVQLASFGGVSLLTFLTILINLFAAEFFIQKKSKYLIYSFSIAVSMFIIGAISYHTFSPNRVGKPFKVAIVSDNTNPETKWNNENGNEFANSYFQLCKEAVATKPDFIIWPETALPWTYTSDDDLLGELIKISESRKLTHVIGINSENASDKKLYNSVFYISNNNRVEGTYSKQILLKGVEEPLGSFLVPFLTQDGFTLSKGLSQQPIATHFGKAGNLICNEVVSENCAAQQVNNGANFLFNLSNDGWFKDSYISTLHFYYARLQAVENRKDISVANNCGFNGIVSSDGSIIAQKKETVSTVVTGTIYPNSNTTLFSGFPYLLPILLLLFITSDFLFINTKFKKA
jgi:apolipoprotein N-acyltransferase